MPTDDVVVTIKTLINKYKLEVLVHKKDVWTASQRLDYWSEQIGDEDVKAQDLPPRSAPASVTSATLSAVRQSTDISAAYPGIQLRHQGIVLVYH